MKKYKKSLLIILCCFCVAFVFLLIGTKCSFLYPFQDWNDANTYFTMGKGLANGLIPYRDLFEQKGPIVYFMHAIAYLISNDTFHGVFIFEVINLTFLLYYGYKMLELFNIKKYKLIVIPVLAGILLSMYSFAYGDSVEEFMISGIMFSMYHLVDIFLNKKILEIKPSTLILNGVAAAFILWIKFTTLGFFAGWMLIIFIALLKEKQVKKAFISCLWYLLGMLIVTIPILLYFYLNGALFDLFNVYFYYNIFLYQENLGIMIKIAGLYNIFFIHCSRNMLFSITFFIGQVYLFKNYKKIFYELLVPFLLLDFTVYFGGRTYYYYFLSFFPYVIFGVIALLTLFQKIKLKEKILFPIILVIFLGITYLLNPNIFMLSTKKEDLVQYRFAKIINASEDNSLLNFAFLDGGFYTVTNTIPVTKYFHMLNIEPTVFPDIFDTQRKILADKKVKFVVLRIDAKYDDKDITINELYENYDLIDSTLDLNHYENYYFRYLLYQRKES